MTEEYQNLDSDPLPEPWSPEAIRAKRPEWWKKFFEDVERTRLWIKKINTPKEEKDTTK